MSFIKRKLRNLYFRLFNNLSYKLGLNLSNAVSPNEIKFFLKKLYPIHPGIELIRLGPDHDGGYLIPNDLDGISSCFSPGVDNESGFELDLAKKGMDVYLADYSVDKPKIDHPKFHFTKKFIGADDFQEFMTLDTWVNRSIPDKGKDDLIIQMDIEGFEYDAILSLSRELLNRFRIIILELHHLDKIFDRYNFNRFDRVFRKLLENHRVVHLHPNNVRTPVVKSGVSIPPFMEITLIRKDRIKSVKFRNDFPHSLDRPNSTFINVVLPEEWYFKF